jgi:hypothetical protein
LKGYDIAKELIADAATVSKDIRFLTAESQNYLNNLAKSTLPFMYQTSISGIKDILKECWNICESTDNNFQRIAALKLAKECHESIFKLVDEGPSVMYLRQLQERHPLSKNQENNDNSRGKSSQEEEESRGGPSTEPSLPSLPSPLAAIAKVDEQLTTDSTGGGGGRHGHELYPSTKEGIKYCKNCKIRGDDGFWTENSVCGCGGPKNKK